MHTLGRLLTIAISALVVGVVSVSGVQASSVSCAQRFPQVSWDLVTDGDVSVAVAGVPDAMAERFGREIAIASGWLTSDIGPVDTAVCLVGDDVSYVGDVFASGSVGFHAHQDLEERFVLIETQRPGFVGPAATYALAHQALWQNNGDEAFPEPIASVIAQYYRARILDRLDLYHYEVMMENFFDTDSVIDWTDSFQEPVQNWIPENNFRAIGDFVDFAVTERGTAILLETDGGVWSEVEGEWRVALRSDLIGRDTPTTDWLLGVGIAVLIIGVAIVAIGVGLYSKYRRKDRPTTAPPVPGFFSER